MALEQLPRGTNAYDIAYQNTMLRIEGQHSEQADLAKQALSWITRAARELSAAELRLLLAIEPGDADLDEDNIPELEDILAACAGLVTVVEESNVIRLVHYTTQEYFDRTWPDWFPSAEEDMAMTCVTYLLFDKFRGYTWGGGYWPPHPVSPTGEDMYCINGDNNDETSGGCTPDELGGHQSLGFDDHPHLHHELLRYAARHWGHHARDIKQPLPELAEFLDCPAAFRCAFECFYRHRHGEGHGASINYDSTGSVTVFHLLATFGPIHLLLDIPGGISSVDPRDDRGMTPLMHAALQGHLSIVTYLLQQGADCSLRNMNHNSALDLACIGGHSGVVDALLRTSMDEIDTPSTLGGPTPLASASCRGHTDVVRLLIATGKVNADFEHDECTPLLHASRNGWLEMCQVLLDEGRANVNWIVDRCRAKAQPRTALMHAANRNHLDVAKLLLSHEDINVDLENYEQMTALHYAAWKGHGDMTRLLTEAGGADVNKHDACDAEFYVRNFSPLMGNVAACDPSLSVTEALLAVDGIELEYRDDLGRTAFSMAARRFARHDPWNCSDVPASISKLWENIDELVRIMDRLEATKRIDINSRDEDGWTPLHHAVCSANLAAVERLLSYDGIDHGARGGGALPPLLTLAKCHTGPAKVVERLRTPRAMTETQYRQHTRLIAIICMTLEVPAAQILDMIRASNFETAKFKEIDEFSLHRVAAANTYAWYTIVQMLVEAAGTEFDRRSSGLDAYDRSALAFVCEMYPSRKLEMVAKELVGLGADVNAHSGNGNTPLVSLTKWAIPATAHPDVVRSRREVDVDGHAKAIAEVLVQAGAETTHRDEHGQSLLSRALARGYVGLVETLLAAGVDPESRDDFGQTALGCIGENTKLSAVQLLLEHGANVHSRSHDGKTPLMCAASNEGLSDICKLLMEAGARLDDRDDHGHNALWYAHQGPLTPERLWMICVLQSRGNADYGRPEKVELWHHFFSVTNDELREAPDPPPLAPPLPPWSLDMALGAEVGDDV